MRTTTLPHPPIYARPAPKPSALLQTLVTLLIGISLFTVFLSIAVLGFNLAYANKIYPGVSVGGVDLSGLTPAEAEERLRVQMKYPKTGKIALQEGANVWIARPEELGFILDHPT